MHAQHAVPATMTVEEALAATEFHHNGGCPHNPGSRGRDKGPIVWRRNGKTRTWKRQPWRFEIPVKHGMYSYSVITNGDLALAHVPGNCPRNEQEDK